MTRHSYKKWAKSNLLILVLLSFWLLTTSAKAIELFDEKHTPHPALSQILQTEGVNSTDFTEILQATQKQWLRKAGGERWHIQDTSYTHEQSCQELGMLETIKPTKKYYDYAVVLGATVPSMQKRMQFLKELLVNRKIKVNKIVLLTGPRKLIPEVDFLALDDSLHQIKDMQTETEAGAYILNRLFPSRAEVDVIDAIEFSGARPNTDDTVRAWLKTNPKSGKVLAISHQPYVSRQEKVLQKLLPKSFNIDGVGVGVVKKVSDQNLLDELARWIYLYK